jgi:hypothetical protein
MGQFLLISCDNKVVAAVSFYYQNNRPRRPFHALSTTTGLLAVHRAVLRVTRPNIS